MDKMKSLEVCVAVADEGSLAGAARSLSLSAPSVTRILGELEAELGVLLFHRSTRALTLTADGTRFVSEARDILERYGAATETARGSHREPRGELRLTAPAMFGQFYVQPLVLEYLDAHSQVRVDAVWLDQVVNLIEARFDVAVRIGALADSSLIATPVGTVRSVVCASEAYLAEHGEPRTPTDLLNHRIVHCSAISDASWRFEGEGAPRLKPRLSVSSIPSAIAAATAGWGVTRVLSYQVADAIERGELREVLASHAVPALPINLVHAEGRSASAKVRAFVALARDRLRNNPFLQGV
ncbi:MAG: LysR family transcriptional regulator [Pseudomonadota bacterium]